MSAFDHLPFVHLATLLALLLLPTLWGRWVSARREVAVALGLTGLAVLLAWNAGPYAIPTAAITWLKEGNEESILHALWDHEPWLGWAMPDWVLPLRAAVFLHAVEAIVAAGLWWSVARTQTRLSSASMVLLLGVANPWFCNAALSEGHAVPVLCCGALVAVSAGVPSSAAVYLRGVATLVGLLALCAAAALRVETVLFGAPVYAALLLGWWAPHTSLRGDRWLATLPSWTRLVGLYLATSATLAGMWAAGDWFPSTTGVRMAPPWAASSWLDLRLPIDLLSFSSVGLTMLVLLGLLRATATTRGAALAFGALLASRVYTQASHLGLAPYETLRYLAFLLGPMIALAIVGAQALDRSRWRSRWALAAGLTLFLPRWTAPSELRGPPWAAARSVQQLGAQFIVQTVEAHRGCVFHSRALDPATGPTAAPHFVAATYRWPVRSADACELYVMALDCNIAGAACQADVDGAERLSTQQVTAPESNLHHGRRQSPATFAVYRLE